ncbi:hypothetical protein HanXRQr2_Chr03g0129491 [Helianthus annuus]|uniref:Uncharacterized protein n=1 Tax=Helianthus annuus TaxID=4232 RepID=A0A9K3JJ87_HELAN|nr:hypothetical protein HanXRQr2_Chr03g0129491 [Helianthus annuus]
MINIFYIHDITIIRLHGMDYRPPPTQVSTPSRPSYPPSRPVFNVHSSTFRTVLQIHKDIQLTSWMDVGDVNAGTLNKSTLLGKKFSFVYNMC